MHFFYKNVNKQYHVKFARGKKGSLFILKVK